MLSSDNNRRLTEVGRATAMGQLLRRYWMPIAAVAELDDHPTKAVRLLSEDLLLYKDKSGRYGLIDRYCPHRGTDLSFAIPEECGIRCVYHGWVFNENGRCITQPFEELANPNGRFKDHIRTTAYPVRANAGLLWAYLGPESPPLVPDWRNFHKKGYRHICFVQLPCNWLQVMENAFDQVHNEWMHDKWSFYLRDGKIPEDRWRISKILHREFDFGWTAEIEYLGSSEIFPDRVILWPNYSCFGTAFEWVVPVDDENTLVVYQHCTRFYADEPFRQARIPYWDGVIHSPDGKSLLTRPPRNQDFVIWCSQGRVADRCREHLGLSDAGVLIFRQKLMQQLKIVEDGGEPIAIVRDPKKYFLMLPESVPSGPRRDGLPGALLTPADIRTVGYVSGFPEYIAKELAQISEQRGEKGRLARVLKEAGWKVGGENFDRSRHYAALRRCGLDYGEAE